MKKKERSKYLWLPIGVIFLIFSEHFWGNPSGWIYDFLNINDVSVSMFREYLISSTILFCIAIFSAKRCQDRLGIKMVATSFSFFFLVIIFEALWNVPSKAMMRTVRLDGWGGDIDIYSSLVVFLDVALFAISMVLIEKASEARG